MTTKEQKEYEKYGLSSEKQLKEYLHYQQNPMSEEELQNIILKEVKKELQWRIDVGEERIKFISKATKDTIIQKAFQYYEDKRIQIHLEPLLPESRVTYVVDCAVIDVLYTKEFIAKQVEKEFEHAFLLTAPPSFTHTKEAMATAIEIFKNGREFFTFDEASIPWRMHEFLFAIIEQTYKEEIHFEETNQDRLEWLKDCNETEIAILDHFERLNSTHHDGMYGLKFTSFPKELLIDIAKTIKSDEVKEQHIQEAVSHFIQNLFMKQYPKDKPESEIVSAVLKEYQESIMMKVEEAYQVPSSLQKMIVNYLISIFPLTKEQTWEIPVRLLQDIETLCKKQIKSHMPREVNKWCLLFLQNRLPQIMENNEILIVNYPKQLTLGEVVNASLQYSAKGYPHVLGFVGNQLFLSSKELKMDVQTLQEIQRDDSTVISVTNEEELSVFAIKRR